MSTCHTLSPTLRVAVASRRGRLPGVAASPDGIAGPRRASPATLVLSMLAGFVLLRLVLMVSLGFGNDEAYTIAAARSLDLSYFDHPPLHIWLAHAAMRAVGETRWVRLPFVLLFAGTGWLMFVLTRRLYGADAGVWAVLALNLTPFFTLSAGGWVVPDGLLLFFLLAAVLALVPALCHGPLATPRPWGAWLLGGLCFGLAGLSKYNAVLVALSLAAYVVASPRGRRWLAHPAPYAGAALAGAVIAPVLVWNAQNGWVSFAFQTGRGLPRAGLHPMATLAMGLGEMALLSPWIALPLLWAVGGRARLHAAPWRRRDPGTVSDPPDARGGGDRLLLSLALPTILAFTAMPLWSGHALPHWPMPAWLFLYPLLGAWIADGRPAPRRARRWAVGSAVAFAALLVAGVTASRDGWASGAFAEAGRDPTLEALDWTQLRTAPLLGDAHPAFVVTVRWMDAGKVAVALGPDVPAYVFSDDPRQFAFSPSVSRHLGQDAVIVMPARLVAARLPPLRPFFSAIDPIEHLWIGRGGRPEVDLAVIRAHGLLAPFPLPYPHRLGPEELP